MIYENLESCLCCGEKDLMTYLDLGSQPLANSYHKKDIDVFYFPLKVNVCRNCYHNQLTIAVEPSLMFKNYLYVSGTTQTFRDHCRRLAEDAVSRYRPKRVLDIAANDGTLLSYFKDLGCEVLGVDPAENLQAISKAKGVDVIVDYWREESEKIVTQKFDVITGTNVFAHVSNPYGFLRGCHKALADDGTVILEFPYCNKMVEHVEFDTVYHEHISYFLVNSFAKLAERAGFHIADILETPIHGGSIRFFIRKDLPQHAEKAQAYILEEYNRGLYNIVSYQHMANCVEVAKNALIRKVHYLRAEGYKVIGYGASAKGNTMLNHFNLKLDYIVDDNPMKCGYLTPGQDIPIQLPQTMAEEKDRLAIVILSWNFYEEIKKKIKNIRQREGDIYLLYVPSVRVENG